MFPELLELGSLHVRSYGAMLALGFLVGAWLSVREGRKVGLDPDQLLSFIFVILLSGVLGCRLFYVLGHLDYYGTRPLEMLYLWRGGLTLWGGFVVATPIGIWYTRRHKMDTWKVADVIAAPSALTAAFGRVGCFLNGCCYGLPTSAPWGIHFPEDSEPHLHFGDQALHPAQLYNVFAGLIVFVIVLVGGKYLRAPGQRWWLFLGLYALLRIMIDTTRYYEESAYLLNLSGVSFTQSQIVGFVIFLVSVIAFLALGRHASHAPPREAAE